MVAQHGEDIGLNKQLIGHRRIDLEHSIDDLVRGVTGDSEHTFSCVTHRLQAVLCNLSQRFLRRPILDQFGRIRVDQVNVPAVDRHVLKEGLFGLLVREYNEIGAEL